MYAGLDVSDEVLAELFAMTDAFQPQQVELAPSVMATAPMVALMEADADDPTVHPAAGKGERHAIFARWVVDELLPPAAAAARGGGGGAGGRTVLDVAGGKGHLSDELRSCGLAPVLVDPCAVIGRSSTMVAGVFAAAAAAPPTAAGAAAEPQPEPEPGSDADSTAVRCMTLQELAATEPQLIARCAALVGLHPDEATEHIVDLALAHGKAFAVLPCCVMPHLFPTRNLKSSGALVVSLETPRTRPKTVRS